MINLTWNSAMDWKQSCIARLPEYLDDSGDLAPPWERFPDYERYSLGWRMGAGEDWLGLWHVFLEQLDAAFEARLAYLRRHPPAPFTWADAVSDALHSSPSDEKSDDEDATIAKDRRGALLEKGLIASDVAYPTWLRQQQGVRWPWTYSSTPERAARHCTRDLEFWSRQVAGLRGDPGWTVPPVPVAWQSCARPLATGETGLLDPDRGLLSLARSLAAGHVTPPWQLGLTTDDFTDSIEDDMGYVDAFRLWGMSAFDDHEHLQRYLGATRMPKSWQEWMTDQLPID
jgi:hypothetical protein